MSDLIDYDCVNNNDGDGDDDDDDDDDDKEKITNDKRDRKQLG